MTGSSSVEFVHGPVNAIPITVTPTISDRLSYMLFGLASTFSEPACKVSELQARVYLVDELHQHAAYWKRCLIKLSLYIKLALFAIVAPVLALVGMMLRAIVRGRATILCIANQKIERPWYDTEKVLMWNVCAPAGGYAITDGGLLPWRERWIAIRDKIIEQEAGVVALLEVFDGAAALQMAEWLSATYAHVYFGIGVRAVGVSSGVLLASKGPIQDVRFTPFVASSDEGRAAFAEKGVLECTIANTRLMLTHLRHSEEPERPTDSERQSRARQMQTITEMAQRNKDAESRVVLMGDLNMEPKELDALSSSRKWFRGVSSDQTTWGGDGWCASKVGKLRSKALTLDYCLSYGQRDSCAEREILNTDFDGDCFNPAALSDHQGLLATIKVQS